MKHCQLHHGPVRMEERVKVLVANVVTYSKKEGNETKY